MEDIVQLVCKWKSAVSELATAKARVNSAECVLLNASNALGRVISPGDMGLGEEVCILHNDLFITVRKTERSGNGTFRVGTRPQRSS